MGECLIVRRGGEAYELPTLNGSYPANVTVVESATASASFSVQIATPGKPAEYTYQWYVNSAKVTGATGSSYTKTGLTAAATYSVYCVVTNKAGTVTSRVATLTVESSLPVYTYTGSSQFISDGGRNWRIKFLTSGTLLFSKLYSDVDAFLVGGGGGGTNYWNDVTGGGGGGAGYTTTGKNIVLTVGTPYVIAVGGGGSQGNGGGTSTAFSFAAGGGASSRNGGSGGGQGGSGGGGHGGKGGADGSNGGGDGGAGQGRTTREFGDSTGAMYAYGGNGGTNRTSNGTGGIAGDQWSGPTSGGVNSGSGGGSRYANNGSSGSGGSGIVIVRNAR